ncbi:hypothetical protein NVP1187O_139 [Vibrio phage 1.187.O._10N.286.49.F1]|nr:hypothetical protein NVP1187O_139 [Vibrio phage 1.187.O._10N.286.49.F1]
MKVGQIVKPWTKDTCQCGAEYYVSRCDERAVTEKDMYCSRCNDAFELDLVKRDLENAKKFIQSLIDVSNELNYRLRKTDQSEGFYHHIELAENFLKEVK